MLLLGALIYGLVFVLFFYLLAFTVDVVVLLILSLIQKIAFRTYIPMLKLRLLLKGAIFLPLVLLSAMLDLKLYLLAALDFLVIVGILILIAKKLKKKGD